MSTERPEDICYCQCMEPCNLKLCAPSTPGPTERNPARSQLNAAPDSCRVSIQQALERTCDSDAATESESGTSSRSTTVLGTQMSSVGEGCVSMATPRTAEKLAKSQYAGPMVCTLLPSPGASGSSAGLRAQGGRSRGVDSESSTSSCSLQQRLHRHCRRRVAICKLEEEASGAIWGASAMRSLIVGAGSQLTFEGPNGDGGQQGAHTEKHMQCLHPGTHVGTVQPAQFHRSATA
jgi:hypothetical protein